MSEELSRRSFIRGGAAAVAATAVGAAGVLSGCSSQDLSATGTAESQANENSKVPPAWDATVPEAWDREVEMLVLGCGIAGACGAVEGYDLGLDVLVVDAAPTITECCCTQSGGALCGCGTRIQEDFDVIDDVEVMIQDVRNDGGDLGDPEVIRAFCELSGETVDWLEDLGCDVIQNVSLNEPSHTIARTYNTNPPGNGLGWMEGLQGAIEERGIGVLSDTRAQKLYRDADGVVVGAHVEAKSGETLDIRATKGVLLAVGGLGNNVDMWNKHCLTMKELSSEAKRIVGAAPADVQGDGYRMLEEINGYCYPSPPNYGPGGVAVSNDGPASGILLPFNWKDSLIEVNKDGKRFNDESSFHVFYDLKTPLKQPEMWHVCIFDETARLGQNGQTNAQPIIDEATANGMDSVKTADTIEELAEMFGLPADAVRASVDEFNSYIGKTGETDPYGRTAFEGQKIETPPFWGIEENAIIGTSKGGSKVNPQAQVLDRHGEVITHLYAAGEIAFFPTSGNAAIHIVGGCNGSGANFGRIAARGIAEETALA